MHIPQSKYRSYVALSTARRNYTLTKLDWLTSGIGALEIVFVIGLLWFVWEVWR